MKNANHRDHRKTRPFDEDRQIKEPMEIDRKYSR